jgi:hypothetical protein
VVDELNTTYAAHADAQDRVEHNNVNVAFIEEQIAKLEKKLAAKKAEQATLSTQMAAWERSVATWEECRPGLCLRSILKYCIQNSSTNYRIIIFVLEH